MIRNTTPSTEVEHGRKWQRVVMLHFVKESRRGGQDIHTSSAVRAFESGFGLIGLDQVWFVASCVDQLSDVAMNRDEPLASNQTILERRRRTLFLS